MSRVGYNLKQSFSQMNRNKGMYFTSTMAITAMMLILGLFFVAFININLFAASIEKDYNVIQIYLADGSKQDTVQSVGSQLEAMDGKNQTYVEENEWIRTEVLPYEEAAHKFVDGKNLIALFLYERWLKAQGR
jgi:cell division protein FtsX